MDDETTYHPDLAHPYLPSEDTEVPCLKVYAGPLKGKEYPLLKKEEYIIGRDQTSDIFLDEKVVSRKHAKIMRKVNEYVICDLNSVNGVYVNNLKLDKVVLQHGDTIQIGSSIFQFQWHRR